MIDDYMEQNVGLNKAQLGIMRLLSHFTTEQEVKELNDLICSYYAKKSIKRWIGYGMKGNGAKRKLTMCCVNYLEVS